ncbi:unnamed protein product [Didymodactylos carnosus]|uniref:Uncharacterized protein n=1 Tax=Didymodactylos carnosus TaxID=1234261 RepID=A0A815F3Z7_9BILA|nr:unnamed protein product [Didymodactylos carnosus]CAF4164983.1 unnamed protein product [Didymodactylos carnosus]
MTSRSFDEECDSTRHWSTGYKVDCSTNTLRQSQQFPQNYFNESCIFNSKNETIAQTSVINNQSNSMLNPRQLTDHVAIQYQTWNNNPQHVITNMNNHRIFFTKPFQKTENIINLENRKNDSNQLMSLNNTVQETTLLSTEDGQTKKKRTQRKTCNVQPRKREKPQRTFVENKTTTDRTKKNNTEIVPKGTKKHFGKTNVIKRMKRNYHSIIIQYFKSKNRKKSVKKLEEKMEISTSNVESTSNNNIGLITNLVSFESEQQHADNSKRDDILTVTDHDNNGSSLDKGKSSIILPKLKITLDQHRNVEAIYLCYHRLKPTVAKTDQIVNEQECYDKNINTNIDEDNFTLLLKAVELLENSENTNQYRPSLTDKVI